VGTDAGVAPRTGGKPVLLAVGHCSLGRTSATPALEARPWLFSELLLREGRERVPILVHDLVGDFHRLLEIGVGRQRLNAAAREFGNIKLLATLEIEALHQACNAI